MRLTGVEDDLAEAEQGRHVGATAYWLTTNRT